MRGKLHLELSLTTYDSRKKMPVLLTKPFNVGDLGPDGSEGYKFCQLSALVHNGITFSITLEYQIGTASGDYYEIWERGAGTPIQYVDVPGEQVVPLWSQLPQDGESVGQAIRRVTYEYLIDNGYIAGTIVNTPPLPPVAASTNDTAAATTTATTGTDAATSTTAAASADTTAAAATNSGSTDSSSAAAATTAS